jgi:gliding motility-associated-like protein
LYSNTVNITVVPPVTAANAGADQSLCNTPTATLAGNTPTNGTGTWTQVSGSTVSFTDAHSPTSTITGLSAGTFSFVWTISNGVCSSSSDTVDLVIFPGTVPGVLQSDAFVCENSNSGSLTLSGYTGTIIRWESSVDSGSSWTVISNTTANYHYQQLTGTTQFRAVVQSGPCNAVASNTVTVHVNPNTVPGKMVVQQQTVCALFNSGSLQLKGFTGTILQWEQSSDSGRNWQRFPESSDTYTYNNLTQATWFRVLVQSGVCAAGYSDTAFITVDAATVAGYLSGDTISCMGMNKGMIRLNANNGSVQQWEYSTTNGNNWTSVTETQNNFGYLNLIQTTAYRALLRNGVCESRYTNPITVTVVQPVTPAVAGIDQVFCNAETTATLQANIPGSGVGVWSMLQGPSNVAFDNATAAVTAVKGLQPGLYRLGWTISNGVCPASADTLELKVDHLTPDFNLAAVYECGQTRFHFLDSSYSRFGIAEWKWSVNPGDTATGKDFSHTYTTSGGARAGLTIKSNTGCTASSAARYQVVIYEYPKANINAISEACKKQLLEINSEISSRDSIAYLLWNLGNGQKMKDTAVRIQYYSEGNYTVKLVVSTVNQCFDSAYKAITIHPTPKVNIKADQVVCKGQLLELSADGAMSYIWKDSTDHILCDNCSAFRVRPSANTSYKVIGFSEYGCSDIASTQVRVIPPLQLTAKPEDTLCIGQSVRLNVSGANLYTWRNDPGLSNYKTANPVAKPSVTTVYRVVGSDNYQCFSDSADIRITVGNPTEVKIKHDSAILAGTAVELRAVTRDQNIKKWEWSGHATFSCLSCAVTKAIISLDEQLKCTATNIYGCVTVDTVTVKTFCPGSEVFIPNAFSPDGDGINDMLFVQGRGLRIIKSFRVYSRWGELVFEKTNFMPGDKSMGWDGKVRGKAVSPDVFVYVCEAVCERGSSMLFKGNVAILK